MMLCGVVLWRWLAALMLVAIDTVVGFGYLSFPPATYRDTKLSQIFTADMNTSIHPTFFAMRQTPGTATTARRVTNPQAFVDRLAFADYTSLRDFADEYFPGCGNSNIDDGVAPVNVFNASVLMWRNEDEKFGFYQENDGPCETWIDDERVQYAAKCASTHPGYPGKVSIDFNRCADDRVCVLRFYWFAVEKIPFKLMKHCVKIVNDVNAPIAQENTDPYKTAAIDSKNNTCPKAQPTVRNDSFAVELTLTWEKMWLTDSEKLSDENSDGIGGGSSILIIP